MIRLLWALFVLAASANMAYAVAFKKVADLTAGVLVPHRAIYEISLADRKDGIAVTDVVGRMVFELTGSSCDGYTQNMRMVTRITDDQGKETFSDLRSSTWEKGDGGRFRFTSSHYYDENLQEIVSGTAEREGKKPSISVKLTRPSDTVLTLAGDILFPSQHSLAIIRSAVAGKRLLPAQIYDGSEQGQGFYRTYAFIGNKIQPADKAGSDKLKPSSVALGLGKLDSWPVAISYFDQESKADATPSYELSFRLYPNGVSRNLLINYGDFAVHGTLRQLTYLRAAACK